MVSLLKGISGLLGDKKKPELSVVLQLQNGGHVVAGNQISGSVVFTKDVAIKINAVKLRLIGREWVYKQDEDAPGEVKKRNRLIYDTNTLVLYKGGKNKEPLGISEYPFSLRIPEELPPSAHYPDRAEIVYILKCDIWFPGKPAMSASANVIVHKEASEDFPKLLVEKKSGMFGKNPLVVKWMPKKNSFAAGETIEIDLSIENGTNHEIMYMNVLLAQELNVGGTKNTSNVKQLHVQEPHFPVPKGGKYMEMIPLELPQNLCCSVKANLFTVTYKLIFEVCYSDGGSKKIKFPVQVDLPEHTQDDTVCVEAQEMAPDYDPNLAVEIADEDPVSVPSVNREVKPSTSEGLVLKPYIGPDGNPVPNVYVGPNGQPLMAVSINLESNAPAASNPSIYPSVPATNPNFSTQYSNPQFTVPPVNPEAVQPRSDDLGTQYPKLYQTPTPQRITSPSYHALNDSKECLASIPAPPSD